MLTGQIESFLQFHANWKAAYKYCYFAYLTSKHGGATRLIQGTLFFRHLPFGFGPHRVETEHVLAGTLTFQGGYEQAVTVLRGLLAGRQIVDEWRFCSLHKELSRRLISSMEIPIGTVRNIYRQAGWKWR